jgi:hypothetical protein
VSEKSNRKESVPHQGKARSSTLTHLHRIQSNTMVPTVPESAVGMGVMCQALLDSGSLAGDFINGNMLSALNGVHYLRSDNAESRVCSGLDNKCISLSVFLDVVMEVTQKHYYPLAVRIFQDSPIDMIVGRETIK